MHKECFGLQIKHKECMYCVSYNKMMMQKKVPKLVKMDRSQQVTISTDVGMSPQDHNNVGSHLDGSKNFNILFSS